jgi:MoxR-like ATPase
VKYPERDEELEVINRTTGTRSADVARVMSAAELMTAQKLVREIPIASHLVAYALDLVRATRLDRGGEGEKTVPDFVKQYVEWGAGPRAAQYLVLGAKARAFMEGRTHVTATDIQAVAYPVLTHRVLVNFAAQADRVSSVSIIERILKHVGVPDRKNAIANEPAPAAAPAKAAAYA